MRPKRQLLGLSQEKVAAFADLFLSFFLFSITLSPFYFVIFIFFLLLSHRIVSRFIYAQSCTLNLRNKNNYFKLLGHCNNLCSLCGAHNSTGREGEAGRERREKCKCSTTLCVSFCVCLCVCVLWHCCQCYRLSNCRDKT